eukprot:scaffold73098_cov43-Cyclotella_meneghiniana.AAC.1
MEAREAHKKHTHEDATINQEAGGAVIEVENNWVKIQQLLDIIAAAPADAIQTQQPAGSTD